MRPTPRGLSQESPKLEQLRVGQLPSQVFIDALQVRRGAPASRSDPKTEDNPRIEAVGAGEAVFGAPNAQYMIACFPKRWGRWRRDCFRNCPDGERNVLDLIAPGNFNQT
jgi:hypothetical protein